MVKRIEKIFDVITGEENIIEREETSEEKNQRETAEKEIAMEIAKINELNDKKSRLLERLGITEEEAKLLLS